jgi:hypothetical protein
MPATATESTFELATIERLQQLGYRYCHGTDISRPTTEVVIGLELRAYLGRRYRHLPPEALDLAIERILAPEGVNLERPSTGRRHTARMSMQVSRVRSKWCCAGARFPAIRSVSS